MRASPSAADWVVVRLRAALRAINSRIMRCDTISSCQFTSEIVRQKKVNVSLYRLGGISVYGGHGRYTLHLYILWLALLLQQVNYVWQKTSTGHDGNWPSRTMPTAKHFWKRQNWQRFLCRLSMTQLWFAKHTYFAPFCTVLCQHRSQLNDKLTIK